MASGPTAVRITGPDLDALHSEVAGTSVGDTVEAVVWRGSMTPRRLMVRSWSETVDAGRAVQDQITLTVADEEGDLAAYGLGDLLAPGGSRLTLTWVSGTSGIRVPWGVYRIRAVDPGALRVRGGRVRRIGASVITVRADGDPQCSAEIERLDAEPVREKTSLAEARRLLAGIGQALDADGITDTPVPAGLVYEEGRLDAIEDHLARCHAVGRTGADGSLEAVPLIQPPAWTVAGGEEGVLIGASWTLSDEGVYNAATSRAEIERGDTRIEIVGRAYQDTGPLAYGGPYGRVPIFHQSPAQTQTGVVADARTLLANRRTGGVVDITVDCLLHPALQVHDWVTLVTATTYGTEALTGRVTSISRASLSGAGSTPAKRMSMTVAVPLEVLDTVSRRAEVARG